jgi:putative phosphoesterase
VRHIGVSNFDVGQLRRAQAIAPVETLQPPYSLLERAVEDEILPFAQSEDIGVIVYSPMASGLLTGAMTAERIAAMPDDDWRKHDPRFQEPQLSEHLALVARLEQVAERHDTTAGAIAVAWTLQHQAVHGAIVGFRRPDQVQPLALAGNVELTDDGPCHDRRRVSLLLAIISDTHLPRGSRALPAECVQRLRAADLILHAGDIATAEVLADLRAIGPPVEAVYGNVDDAEVRALLPSARLVAAGAARIAMVHNAGPAGGRLARLHARFAAAGADAVVFGHSHIPLHERDPATGFQIFNPGSPTDRRRQPTHTMGQARIGEDGAVSFELIDLG